MALVRPACLQADKVFPHSHLPGFRGTTNLSATPGAQANKRSLLARGISIGTSVVAGNIFNSNGVHVGVVRGDAVFGLRGQKLYDLKGSNIYKLNGDLGACLNSRCSMLGESDSTLGYEQVFSPLEYRSDTASAAECAGLRAERPCLAVYR